MNKEMIEKIGLIIIIISGLGYAYYTYGFSPEWQVSQKVKGQLIERQQHYNQLVSFQQNKSDMDKTIESITSEANDLSAQIPPRLDNPQIMVDIYTNAKLHDVDPKTLQFEPLQDKGSYQAVGMTFTCKGNVEDVLGMISSFEYTPLQKLSLQSVTITAENPSSTSKATDPSELSSAPLVVSAQIKLTAYACSLGTADINGPDPAFMTSQFGVNSAAQLFK